MNTPSFLIALAGLAASCLSARLEAQDIVYIDLFKRAWYEQNTAGDPVLIPLAEDPFNAATSAVIPAGTLVAHKDYMVQIEFTRFSQISSATTPEIYTGFEAYNRAPLKTRSGGGPLEPSVLTGFRRLGNGDLEVTIACTPGRPLAIHSASSLRGNWGVLQTSTPASSPATVVVPRATLGNQQYLRASQE